MVLDKDIAKYGELRYSPPNSSASVPHDLDD